MTPTEQYTAAGAQAAMAVARLLADLTVAWSATPTARRLALRPPSELLRHAVDLSVRGLLQAAELAARAEVTHDAD